MVPTKAASSPTGDGTHSCGCGCLTPAGDVRKFSACDAAFLCCCKCGGRLRSIDVKRSMRHAQRLHGDRIAVVAVAPHIVFGIASQSN